MRTLQEFLQGKVFLIGLTFIDNKGDLIEQYQTHGIVSELTDDGLIRIKRKDNVTPALDFDYLLENIIGLTIDGKMPNGKAGLVQELVTLKYLDSKSYLADIPIGLQKFLMNVIAPIGRMFGYRAIYKKYSGIEK